MVDKIVPRYMYQKDGNATIKDISKHANISYDNCKKTLHRGFSIIKHRLTYKLRPSLF